MSNQLYTPGDLLTSKAIPYRLSRSSNRMENSSPCRESNSGHSALSRVLSGADIPSHSKYIYIYIYIR